MGISKSEFVRALAAWALLGVAAIPQAARAQTKLAFDYTGSSQAFIVPEGVTSLTVKLWGAGGGYGGGSGAFVTGLLSVTPGATLTLLVGGGGRINQGGFGGGGGGAAAYGGGGGRSAIRNGGVELVTAGGGGGDIGGGAGGLLTGGDGVGGFGGGQLAGGAGANGGADGSSFQGGVGGNGGGGGGGGWFGGGGGGGDSSGGGGSSFLDNLTASGASEAGSTGYLSTGVAPGGTSDADYATGIGRGGSIDDGDQNGGDGRIVLMYTPITAPEPGSLALLAIGGIGLLARRKRPGSLNRTF